MECQEEIGKNQLSNTYQCNQIQSHSTGAYATADFYYLCIRSRRIEHGIIWYDSETMEG